MDTLLVRLKRFGLRVPGVLWRRVVAAESKRSQGRLDWFTPDHHRVRDLAVTGIAAGGAALSPQELGSAAGLEQDQLRSVLNELERGKTFLYRTNRVDIDWAYPVTAEDTGHRIRLDSGERFFAA